MGVLLQFYDSSVVMGICWWEEIQC